MRGGHIEGDVRKDAKSGSTFESRMYDKERTCLVHPYLHLHSSSYRRVEIADQGNETIPCCANKRETHILQTYSAIFPSLGDRTSFYQAEFTPMPYWIKRGFQVLVF